MDKVNWKARPVIIRGEYEFEVPNYHCQGKGEVTWWERWDKEPGAYRCDECGQRFTLRPRRL